MFLDMNSFKQKNVHGLKCMHKNINNTKNQSINPLNNKNQLSPQRIKKNNQTIIG